MSFIIRKLDLRKDLENGFRESLDALSPVDSSYDTMYWPHAIYRDSCWTYVADDGERVIGTASLLIEYKLSRGCKPVGHIEDVAVSPSFHGQGVGLALVEYAVHQAKLVGCRKVILDCDEKLIGFYQKAGFRVAGVAMRLDLE